MKLDIDIDHKIIPPHWMPTDFYTFTFEGFKNFDISVLSNKFRVIICLASVTVNEFIKSHKDEYAFTEPYFCLKPNGTIFVKIATLEKDRFEEMKKFEEIKKIRTYGPKKTH